MLVENQETKRGYWQKKLTKQLTRRLYGLRLGVDWTDYIAHMSNYQIAGRINQEKNVRYLIMTRDAAAIEILRKANLPRISSAPSEITLAKPDGLNPGEVKSDVHDIGRSA